MRNLRPFPLGLAGNRWLGQASFAAFHNETMLKRVPRGFNVRGARARLVMANVIADEMARDAELHVGLDVLVVGYIELRDQRFEVRLVDQKMQVRGPPVMAGRRAQQIN